MTTAILPAPSTTRPGSEDDDFDHIYCCDPNRALCGADVTDDEDLGEDAEPEAPCPTCEVIDDADLGCGAKGCV